MARTNLKNLFIKNPNSIIRIGILGANMFSIIESYAEKSQTITEACENVTEMSFLKEIIIFIVLFILAIIALSIVQAIFSGLNLDKQSPLGFFFNHISYIALPIMVIIYATKLERRSLRSVGFTKGNLIPSIVKGFLIGFLLILAIVILSLLFGQFKYAGIDFSTCIYLPLFLIGYAIQSFGEEIICRGWALTYLAKRHSILFAIVISGIIFVLPHMGVEGFDLLTAINIFLIGTLFAIIFLKYDNIWVNGTVHATWNFLMGPIFGLDVSGFSTLSILKLSKLSPNILNGGTYGPESSLIVTIVVVIALIITLYCFKK